MTDKEAVLNMTVSVYADFAALQELQGVQHFS